MSLLDYFTKEGRLKRHCRRMADRDTPPEDRDASAYWLFEEGSPKAIMGLISRFDLSITQQIKDHNEKEFVYEMLVRKGDETIVPLEAWLRQCKQFAWPIKLLEQLKGEEAAIQMVYWLLDQEYAKDGFQPEKKKELLKWLTDRTHAGTFDSAVRFVTDFDEDVRYAAAEVLLAPGTDNAREPLLAALANRDDDSNRLKVRLCDAFRSRGWSVAGADLEGCLPPGYAVEGNRIVPA